MDASGKVSEGERAHLADFLSFVVIVGRLLLQP
jgi:hypothetical protein